MATGPAGQRARATAAGRSGTARLSCSRAAPVRLSAPSSRYTRAAGRRRSGARPRAARGTGRRPAPDAQLGETVSARFGTTSESPCRSRRREPPPRNIHVAPAASPRAASTKYSRRREPPPRNIHVAAAASPRAASTEYPRRARGVAATLTSEAARRFRYLVLARRTSRSRDRETLRAGREDALERLARLGIVVRQPHLLVRARVAD